MDFQAFEGEIVARLKDSLGVLVHVQAWPDAVESFQYTQPNGAVLVRFSSDTYSAPVANRAGKVIQDRTAEWSIVALHRNLSSHSGVYPLLESIRSALTGWTLPSAPESTVLFPIRGGFIGRAPDKWIYQLVFGHTLPEVQA